MNNKYDKSELHARRRENLKSQKALLTLEETTGMVQIKPVNQPMFTTRKAIPAVFGLQPQQIGFATDGSK
jgi:hypothetical protein